MKNAGIYIAKALYMLSAAAMLVCSVCYAIHLISGDRSDDTIPAASLTICIMLSAIGMIMAATGIVPCVMFFSKKHIDKLIWTLAILVSFVANMLLSVLIAITSNWDRHIFFYAIAVGAVQLAAFFSSLLHIRYKKQ